MKIERPGYVKDRYLRYLDTLRETGVTNMMGACPWLTNAFPKMTKDEASGVLSYWQQTFGDSKR